MQQKGWTPGWLGDWLGCFFSSAFCRMGFVSILLMEEILHQLREGSLSHYLQGCSTIQSVVVWDFWTINSRDYNFIAFVLIPCQRQYNLTKEWDISSSFNKCCGILQQQQTTTTRWQNPSSWTWWIGWSLFSSKPCLPCQFGWHSWTCVWLHPPETNMEPENEPWIRRFLFKTIIFRFHVSFRGGYLFWWVWQEMYGNVCFKW